MERLLLGWEGERRGGVRRGVSTKEEKEREAIVEGERGRVGRRGRKRGAETER